MKIAHVRSSDEEVESLIDHLSETAKLSSKFAAKIGMSKTGELLGLIHDIGKASDDFQKYISSSAGLIKSGETDYMDPKKNKGKVNHSNAGAEFIYSLSDIDDRVKEILEAIVLSHHGGLPDFVSVDGNGFIEKRIKTPVNKGKLYELISKVDIDFSSILST